MHAAVREYGSVAIRGDIKDLANETSATRHVIRPGGWPLPHSHTGAMYTQNDPSIISISCVTSTHTHTHRGFLLLLLLLLLLWMETHPFTQWPIKAVLCSVEVQPDIRQLMTKEC